MNDIGYYHKSGLAILEQASPSSPFLTLSPSALGRHRKALAKPWHLGIRLPSLKVDKKMFSLYKSFTLWYSVLATQNRQRYPSALWPSVSRDPGCRRGAGVCFPGYVSGMYTQYSACPGQHS